MPASTTSTPWVVALLALPLAVGCVRNLPPAPTPERVVPDVEAGPPPGEGQGRLIVDVVEEPTPVDQVTIAAEERDHGTGKVSYHFTSSTQRVCPSTPCVLDAPEGNVLLQFPVMGGSGTETELVHVGAEPSVYRRSLSVYDDDTGAGTVLGILGTSIGGASAITGVALLPVGLAKDIDGLTIAGAVTLGAGAALIALGVWLLDEDAKTFRPGSAVHFDL